MPPDNIGAFTVPQGDYPDFISVNIVSPTAVVISVRSGGRKNEQHAAITMTHTEYANVLRDMVSRWAHYVSVKSTILGGKPHVEPPKLA